MSMTLFEKVLEIYKKYYICPCCLGRMFSLLGSNTTNKERGNSLLLSLTLENHSRFLRNSQENETESLKNLKILAENARFSPAQKVLENEGYDYSKTRLDQKCFLCQDIFLYIQEYILKAKELSNSIEFDNLLIGTRLDSQIINQEDYFKGEFNLLEAESFKSHFNRYLGKKLSKTLNKPPEFNNPDVVFIFNLNINTFDIEILFRPVFLAGRYNKLIRGIPQTHWNCRKCLGKGCELCNFSGKQYETSVEELISPEFVKATKASSSKFHGAGREDIDVRMLGTGRPFILELKDPKIRTLDLEKILEKVNQINKGKVNISDLKYSTKKEVIKIKIDAENTRKVYKAIVQSEKEIWIEDFEDIVNKLKIKLESQKIQQKTPIRVSHRRADLMREKYIYKIDGAYIKPNLYEFTIETQGGTYIKELIHGDENRTSPSFAEVFNVPLICKELDVIEIKY